MSSAWVGKKKVRAPSAGDMEKGSRRWLHVRSADPLAWPCGMSRWPVARSLALRDALDHVSRGEPWRIAYTTHQDGVRLSAPSPAHIAVLDASFNPPTRAHAALASLPRTPSQPFDAHLLLFSVRNADKGRGRAGDASPIERLEMMELLAHELEAQHLQVVVALVDEPLVFAKSTLVHAHMHLSVPYRLYWLVGSDTLTRVFHPRYYDSEAHLEACCERFFGVQGSRMICAERSAASVQGTITTPTTAASDAWQFVHAPGPARTWYERGAIELRPISTDAAQLSSTAVRRFLHEAAPEAQRPQLCTMVPPSIADYLISHSMYH